MQSHKQIIIELERNTNKDEKTVILEINNFFPKEELYMENGEDKIILNFKILDLVKFRDKLNSLVLQNNLKDNNSFSQIINKIENIKNYGIKSGKRLYVDYNKERKVKNRKQIVKDRGMYFYAKDSEFQKEIMNCLKNLRIK